MEFSIFGNFLQQSRLDCLDGGLFCAESVTLNRPLLN